MNLISILDDNTINQIAAGEVVERPASIIKELVENSIDAECTAITIEIKDGGISYIRVTDNGKGMSPQDARVSFERHATSKIGSSADLKNILTLGFRGEALASIAAVTQIEMITRERNSLSGMQIVKHGGRVISEKEIGCPEGTTVITQNLFFNTPARLKFLKSPRTETAYISDLIGKLILANPGISFKYINNGNIIYHSPGDGVLRNAIFSLYGKEVIDQLLPIKSFDNPYEIRITGYLGKPSLARKNRSHQSYFVNGRYVKSGLLTESIETACKPYLTINQFPWAVVHMDIAPDMIDVNVHPAKTEIRFKDEKAVSQVLAQHIENTLRDNPYIPELKVSSFKASIYENDEVDDNSQQLEVFSSISSTNSSVEIINDSSKGENTKQELYDGDSTFNVLKENVSKGFVTKSLDTANSFLSSDLDNETSMRKDINANTDNRDISIPLKVIGKIFTTYILVEGENQCFLIDQHAAHERLLFEKYKYMLSNQAVVTQQLLPPVIIEVTHGEHIIINESIELFYSLGFELEAFGGRSFAIRGVPVILGSSNVKEFFQELLDNVEEYSHGSNYKLKIDDIIRMSCKKAVKAGDNLSEIEILKLLDDLMQKKIPMTCPHGRPIMIVLTRNELEKMFRRIQ